MKLAFVVFAACIAVCAITLIIGVAVSVDTSSIALQVSSNRWRSFFDVWSLVMRCVGLALLLALWGAMGWMLQQLLLEKPRRNGFIAALARFMGVCVAITCCLIFATIVAFCHHFAVVSSAFFLWAQFGAESVVFTLFIAILFTDFFEKRSSISKKSLSVPLLSADAPAEAADDLYDY